MVVTLINNLLVVKHGLEYKRPFPSCMWSYRRRRLITGNYGICDSIVREQLPPPYTIATGTLLNNIQLHATSTLCYPTGSCISDQSGRIRLKMPKPSIETN